MVGNEVLKHLHENLVCLVAEDADELVRFCAKIELQVLRLIDGLLERKLTAHVLQLVVGDFCF